MMLELVHSIPGRLRLRGSPCYRDPGMAATVRRELLRIDGVESVTVNRATGSFVVCYDHDNLPLARLWTCLREAELVGAKSSVPAWAASAGSSMGDALIEAASRMLVKKLAERSAGALLAALI